ncbi:MAG: HAD family hydrolase [bacterium]
MKKIKLLVFDFGDVFIDLDKSATIQLIKSRFPDFEITNEINNWNNQYEIGAISSSQFISIFTNHFKLNDPSFFEHAWNAIIQDVPDHRMTFLKNLSNSGRFKIVLLSNTNELHIEQVKKNMTIGKYQTFKSYFDAFYLSHEIKLRKPNSEIFDFVLSNHNCEPEEVFYVDDTEEHILSAQKLGIQTWLLNPKEDDVTQLEDKMNALV